MIIIGIDAGCGHSAAVVLNVEPDKLPDVLSHADLPNPEFLEWLWNEPADLVVLECMLSNGGASREVLDTAYWNGRYWTAAEFSGKAVAGLTRRAVLKLLFGKEKGNDAAVTQYCAEAYGCKGWRDATGTKKNPGILYGIVSHRWQALGVGLATIKALQNGTAEDVYWDPMHTSSEAFAAARTKRRQKKKDKQERAAVKGQQTGALADKLNKLRK
jgi:hypothetical protein